MISEKNTQELQDIKRKLQLQLSNLLNTKECSKDEINELRSEIKHIDKQIEKKVGSKELKRQEEVRRRKNGKDELIIKTYYGIKEKYKKISEMNIAVNRFLNVVDLLVKDYDSKEKIKI